MEDQTRIDTRRSPVGRLLVLGLTFAVGYVLGSRSAGTSETWDRESEPAEITIDDAEHRAEGGGENGQ